VFYGKKVEEKSAELKQLRLMKFAIGGLVTVMMLGTALFSVQAFTGKFQPDSFQNASEEAIAEKTTNETAPIISVASPETANTSTTANTSATANASTTADTSTTENASTTADASTTTSQATAASEPAQAPAHAVDSQPQPSGFLAVPWIPVSFIRQSMKESSFLQQAQRFFRDFSIKSYPSDKKVGVTDRTVRNQSNLEYSMQAFILHVAKLTAG